MNLAELKKKQVPAIYVLATAAGFLFFIAWHYLGQLPNGFHPSVTPPPVTTEAYASECQASDIIQFRMKEYKYARPLLIYDGVTQDEKMKDLKSAVGAIIQGQVKAGTLINASVYVRKLSSASWISINDNESYNPGSLIKLPVMMAYLRESELQPGLLDKELLFDPAGVRIPTQTFSDETIKAGKKYKIRDLLYQMIVKSDNNATLVLNRNLNMNLFTQLFEDLGLPPVDMHDYHYKVSASDYSKFLRVLYNATYMSNEDADYALSLLINSSFKDGIMKELPNDIQVAHKFGEFGLNIEGPFKQLHESGIVYIANNPYLITVMTKGNDVHQLSKVLGDISKCVYDKLYYNSNGLNNFAQTGKKNLAGLN